MVLERELELEQLSGWIDAAQDSRGATVALEGEAGIGKSTLLGRACALARAAGMDVLSARGGELERDFPYGVVRQLFEPRLRAADTTTRERMLAGAAALATPALLFSAAEGPSAATPGAIPHGLYWLTANLAAERPLLVAVDDAHWGDAASLAFLSYLARRIEGLPVLVVYAARPGEGAVVLPSAGDGDLVAQVLRPSPLSGRATAALVAEALGSDALAAACHHATRGNPFLLRELLHALEHEPDGHGRDGWAPERVAALAPASISSWVLARLDRLGGPARAMAFAVAVLGTNASLRHAAALAELDHATAGATADALADAAILAPGRPLDFAHPLVRTTIYAELAPARRADGHRRAAELLDADGADADAIAPHLLATEPAGSAWAVDRLRAAATLALDRGAPEQACACLERARAEPPPPAERAAVLCELGWAEVRAGRPEAIEHLRAGFSGVLDEHSRRLAARALALALTAAGRVPEAIEHLRPLIGELQRTEPEAAMALEADMFGLMHIDVETAAQARVWIERHDRQLTGVTPGERLLTACFTFEEGLRGEDAQRAVELAELALGGGRLLTEQTPDSHPFSHAVVVLAWADRLEDAERYIDMMIADARRSGSALGLAVGASLRSHVRFRAGRIAEAEADAVTGFEATHRLAQSPITLMSVAYMVDAMVERADLGDAARLLAEQSVDAELPTSTMANPLLCARGRLRLAAGDAAQALRDFEELIDRNERWGQHNPAVFGELALAAYAHARSGDLGRARELAGEQLRRARRWGAPSTVATALRTVGTIEADLDVLRESVVVAEASPARVEHARSLLALGAALRRAGQRTAAREPLRAALDLAHATGARRLAGRARDELVAAGARPRRNALHGVDSLTPSERRVVQLAVDGLANREIAQALFLVTRTVEMHLTNAYRKLGIESRDELARAMSLPGPAAGA